MGTYCVTGLWIPPSPTDQFLSPQIQSLCPGSPLGSLSRPAHVPASLSGCTLLGRAGAILTTAS